MGLGLQLGSAGKRLCKVFEHARAFCLQSLKTVFVAYNSAIQARDSVFKPEILVFLSRIALTTTLLTTCLYSRLLLIMK